MLETSSFGKGEGQQASGVDPAALRADSGPEVERARMDATATISTVVGIVANVAYVGLLSAATLFVLAKLVGHRAVDRAGLADPPPGGPPVVVLRDTG